MKANQQTDEPRQGARLSISYGSTVIATVPGPTPIEDVAREFEQAERDAGEIAEVPFSLTPVIGRASGKQEGLF